MKKFFFFLVIALITIVVLGKIAETTTPPLNTQPYLVSHHENVNIRTTIQEKMVVEMEVGTDITIVGPVYVQVEALDQNGDPYYENFAIASGQKVHISVTTPTVLTLTP